MTKVAKHPKIKATEFTCHAPEAQAVFVAGTFNEWNSKATPMAKSADGNWTVAVELPPGPHEFKFVVDGNWCCEPRCDETNRDCPKCVSNPFGTLGLVWNVKLPSDLPERPELVRLDPSTGVGGEKSVGEQRRVGSDCHAHQRGVT